MTLYKDGVTPKIRQDFQLALSGYATGKTEAITTISRLKALLDIELLYWGQLVEREKAIARLDALTGGTSSGSDGIPGHGSVKNNAITGARRMWIVGLEA